MIDKESQEQKAALTVKAKLMYTIAGSFAMLAFGLIFEITGATLADVAITTHTSFKYTSHAIVIRTIGYSIGSLVAGWAFDRFNRQVGFIIALSTAATITLLIPYETSIHMYFASLLVIGFAASAMDVASSAWILELCRPLPIPSCKHRC